MTDRGVQAVEPAAKRPVAITVICVIIVFGAIMTAPIIFSEIARSIGPWYPPMLAISAVIGLVCAIGLWMMRKWSVYVYTALAAVVQVTLIATGLWNPISLILPGIVIVVMFVYLSKMQ